MTDKKQSKAAAKPPSSKISSEKGAGAAFDTWLESKLHDMFDSVAAEPIPEDLMKVIAELDKPQKK